MLPTLGVAGSQPSFAPAGVTRIKPVPFRPIRGGPMAEDEQSPGTVEQGASLNRREVLIIGANAPNTPDFD